MKSIVGVREEFAHGQMLSGGMSASACSQIMKKVRVTKIAVIIEASDADDERHREPLHRAGAELEEEQRREHGADVGVDDGVHRVA